MAVEELGRAGGLVLAHHVGRRFPGVLIHCDTLLTLLRDLEEEAPRSAAAERVREWVAGYERAMDALRRELPYPTSARVTPPQA